MTKNIPIKNIYYMLAYAYRTIDFSEYKDIGNEDFENIIDLYSEILIIGLPSLIRAGLHKDYISVKDKTTVVRGKIDINSSIKQNVLVDKKLVVVYDEFSEDILVNQILKATLMSLLRNSDLSKEKRKKVFGYLMHFGDVSDIRLEKKLWTAIHYNKQNIRYQFLVDICQFLYEELLICEKGNNKRQSIYDEQKLPSLYERFVVAFYKRETNFNASRPKIDWKIDDGYKDALPNMNTDLVLKNGNKTLIIDAKFYVDNMDKRYQNGETKNKSGNLYQIFSYVKNWKCENKEKVSGMLLYAQTTAENQPNHHYKMSGNLISVMSLNLDQDFKQIHNDLISFAEEILVVSE